MREALPIRWRLTIAFGLALAIVLAATGAFVYVVLDETLDQALERDLSLRTEEITSRVLAREPTLEPAAEPEAEADENVAQILRTNGTVIAATAYEDLRLLTDEQLAAAARGPLVVDRLGDDAFDEVVRIRVSPVTADETYLVLVTASLDEKAEAMSALFLGLTLGLGGALIAACAAGYVVAGMALRPVEALRRHADDISGPELESAAALPVLAADDEIGRLSTTLNAMLGRIAVAQAEQRAAIEQERRFVADASHQLKTPLTIIRSEVDVALLSRLEPNELRAALRSVGEETDRLSQLTDQLLVLAAADENRLTGRLRPVGACELLTAVAAEHQSHATRLGREIVVTAPADLSFPIDRFRLEQAVGNLVDNALRHGSGTVELSASANGDALTLAVQDEGPGFPPELVGAAFDRFRRGSSPTPGTGLGLAVVRAIAEAHGGRADVTDPAWARVAITLPTRQPGQAEADPAAQSMRA